MRYLYVTHTYTMQCKSYQLPSYGRLLCPDVAKNTEKDKKLKGVSTFKTFVNKANHLTCFDDLVDQKWNFTRVKQ